MNLRPLLLSAFLTASLLLLPAAGWSQGVPPLLNYQGRVVVGSTNFDGKGLFKFALVNAGGTTTYWSNDGTSNAGGEPTAAVSLQVTGGLYSLALGDTTLPNMTALPASVFAANADVRLRVWFNDGANGSQLLTPDQRITSVGYAQLAATVPDGAITSAKIGTGAVGAGNLAGGVAGTYQPVSGATATQANTSYAATGTTPVNFTLPSTAKVGDVVTISGVGAGGYSLTPAQGQSVFANGKLDFTWTTVPGTDLNISTGFTSVACSSDGSHVIVCKFTSPGGVRISTDYGATFTVTDPIQNAALVGVAASADFTHLVIAGRKIADVQGGIYVSTNAGATWTVAANTSGRRWTAVASSASGARLVATVEDEGIYTSADFGVTWTATSAPSASWTAVASSADGTRLVAAQNDDRRGLIYLSIDSGATWTATSAPPAAWYSVASSADGSHLAADGDSGVCLSADAGVTWTLVRDVPKSVVASSRDGVHLVAMGEDNAYTSSDGGASWTSTPTHGASDGYSAVASSADGVHLVATEFFDSIHTATGIFKGAQGSETQFQYLGNGQWGTLNQGALAAGSVGNTQLANSSLTINTTNGLVGGGPVALGGVLTLRIDSHSDNLASALVTRDSSGNFSAGTITASLNGSAANASTLGGLTATSANTASTIVSRDGSGNFGAGTITASLSGNATTATNASTLVGMSATSANTVNTVVSRDASGNFAAGAITANLSGNATTATTATNATNASALSGMTATNSNTVNTVVSRDASGNFAAGTITANLSGKATSATTATNATNASTLGGMSATSANTASTVVSRDANGSFAAGNISAQVNANNTIALDAEGAVNYGTWLRLGNSATDGRVWDLISSASGNGEGGGKLLFHDNTGNATRMVLDSSGRLGIGQAPVTNALEVNGNASKSTAGSWLANSDARIKTGIHPLTGALEALDRLNPVGFHYTAEYRAAHPEIADVEYQNVIAQEFREVFPDAVKGSGERLADGSEILQVDTYPALIESLAAIKELHAEVERLRREATQKAAADEARFQRMDNAIKSLNKTSLKEGF